MSVPEPDPQNFERIVLKTIDPLKYKDQIAYFEKTLPFYPVCTKYHDDPRAFVFCGRQIERWHCENYLKHRYVDFDKLLEETVRLSWFSCPYYWIKEWRESPKIRLQTFGVVKFGMAQVLLRDLILKRVGLPEFADFVTELADLLERIMNLEFKNYRKMRKWLKERDSGLRKKEFKFALSLQMDMAWQFHPKNQQHLRHDIVQVSFKEHPQVAKEYRRFFDIDSWRGAALDRKSKKGFRPSTPRLYVEYLFALENLKIPEEVREEKSWKRLHQLMIEIAFVVHDIFNVEADSKLPLTYNTLIDDVKEGKSLNEALDAACERYQVLWKEAKEVIETFKDQEYLLPLGHEDVAEKSFFLIQGIIRSIWKVELSLRSSMAFTAFYEGELPWEFEPYPVFEPEDSDNEYC